MYEQLSEKALLERMAADDAAAYEALYFRYWQPLFLFAYKRVKNKEEAKDAVQEVFIGLWLRRHTLQISAAVKTYLFAAVRYEVLRRIAGTSRETAIQDVPEPLLPEAASLTDQLHEKELQQALCTAENLLPGKMKEIYLLSRHQHKSVSVIAAELSLSEQTVKNQLSKALNRLRSHLKESTVIQLMAGVYLLC